MIKQIFINRLKKKLLKINKLPESAIKTKQQEQVRKSIRTIDEFYFTNEGVAGGLCGTVTFGLVAREAYKQDKLVTAIILSPTAAMMSYTFWPFALFILTTGSIGDLTWQYFKNRKDKNDER